MDERIAVVHVIGGGEFGGAERHVLNLVTRLDPAAFAPRVACGYEGRLARALREAGVPVFVPPPGPRGLGALAAELRAAGAAVVHTHGVRGNFFGRLAAWEAGTPAILTTVHSRFDLDYPEPVKRAAYRLLEGLTAPAVTRFVAVSQALAALLVRRGTDPGRIRVIPNGVDTAVFRPDPAAPARLRALIGAGEASRLVGVVARLHPVKGHDLFLRAAAALLEGTPDLPDVRFLVVGAGEPAYRRELEALAGALGLGPRVLFLGERADVPGILAGLDAAVVPSRYEGFSLSVLEAMACGVPVAATAVGAIPEIVVDGANGLLVPDGDAVRLAEAIGVLLRDRPRAERLVRAGLETAGRYTVEAFARRTEALYREVAG